ncbi:glycosyltransferase [Myroides odoratimimus]|uniref:glycosyltransferase n=1 Tax=Myroides odoratimimus TaxID=76832 RepID=UPI0025754682|nr:glycosyltransferase [Myroides odoratimimus]MDM1506884.1 glycosyltransferase [Myroides odoratimimus]MDM1537764.1 glycosyltransferase [Myroides odoratimimus]MDM1677317.1 glycosyltransferase [Myroides odoratimimus]MDM1680390.1 glycosyltransferase [Myroides odoratimimus]
MKKKSNVIFFVTNLDSGGLENYLLRFIKYSQNKFDNIIVFCKGGRGGILEEEYLSIPNLRIVKKTVRNGNIKDYFILHKWLKDFKGYRICDFTGNFSGPVLYLSYVVGIEKRIVFYRSSSNRFKENWVKLKINKLCNYLVQKYATNILANSNYAFEFFFNKTIIDDRYRVIFNGINIEEFLQCTDSLDLGIKSDTIVIGHTGRYNEAKNHNTMLNVAEKLIREHNNVYFLFCGKGVLKSLKPLVREREIEDNIILFENRDDISKVLNSIAIYYFPSITEGQPNALIEAWIKGKIFVASDIRPIKDITPLQEQRWLTNCFDEESQVRLLKEAIMYKAKDCCNTNIAEYAKKEFNAETRFNEFLDIILIR